MPRNWQQIRRRILLRDHGTCTATGCGRPATDVDHIVPAHLGGTDDDANLASLCSAHHLTKTAAEASSWRWRNPTRRPAEEHPGLV